MLATLHNPTRVTIHFEDEGEPGALEELLRITRTLGVVDVRYPHHIVFVGTPDRIELLKQAFDFVGWKRLEN